MERQCNMPKDIGNSLQRTPAPGVSVTARKTSGGHWLELGAVVARPWVAMIEFTVEYGIRDGFWKRVALLSHPVVGALNTLVGLHYFWFQHNLKVCRC
jgi:hypothetical protein